MELPVNYGLLFWFVGERNWTIQNTSTIVKPRRDPMDYGAGDVVIAKFHGKPYRAAIVKLKANKEELADDKLKLDGLLKDMSMSPLEVMAAMGVQVAAADMASVAPMPNYVDGSAGDRPKPQPQSKKRKVKPSTPAVSTTDTGTGSKAKQAKVEAKAKKTAALESSKIMAKKMFDAKHNNSVVNQSSTDKPPSAGDQAQSQFNQARSNQTQAAKSNHTQSNQAHAQSNQVPHNQAHAQSNQAHAQSNQAHAQSNGAQAQSNQAQTQSNQAHAQSNQAHAQSKKAHAQSNQAQSKKAHAQSNQAHAQSNGAQAQSNQAHAQSNGAQAQSNQAHAQSNQAHAQTKSNQAHAQSNQAHAQSNQAHAQSIQAHAQSNQAHAQSNQAESNQAHAKSNQAQSNQTQSNQAHAQSNQTQSNQAQSKQAHAQSNQAHAQSIQAHAQSNQTQSNHTQSNHTQSNQVHAQSIQAHAQSNQAQSNQTQSNQVPNNQAQSNQTQSNQFNVLSNFSQYNDVDSDKFMFYNNNHNDPVHYNHDNAGTYDFHQHQHEQSSRTYMDLNHVNGTNHTSLQRQEEHCRCRFKIVELEKRVEALEAQQITFRTRKVAAHEPAAISPGSSIVATLPKQDEVQLQASDVELSGTPIGNKPTGSQGNSDDLVLLMPGYRARITVAQLDVCLRKAKTSGTALTRLLLLVFFADVDLAQCSARGTKTRAALDQDIINAIVQYSTSKFKCTDRDCIQAINSKCSEARCPNH